MERVGHSFFKSRMGKENAVFGGEVTGHYYFKHFFFADSGIIPSLLILEMLSKKRTSLAELLLPLESKYFLSGEINTRISSDPTEKMKELASAFGPGNKVEWMDGVSIVSDHWHCNVRPSNTEPLLRLNLEATSQSVMESKRDEFLSMIRR